MTHAPSIGVLVVDDELLAREKVRDIVKDDLELHIVGECGNGAEAIESIKTLAPDLILLDVQMPEVGGFEVLEALQSTAPPAPLPHVIFVTAYDTYAVRAFEFHALDYLLKPFDRERLEAALARAKNYIRNSHKDNNLDHRILTLLEQIKNGTKHLERFVVKAGGRIFFLRTSEVEWIEAEGNYVNVHTATRSHMLRETLNGLEAQLDPAKFIRIHRSAIVNLAYVKELQTWTHGEYHVIMQSGKQLTLSRNFRERLQEVLGKNL